MYIINNKKKEMIFWALAFFWAVASAWFYSLYRSKEKPLVEQGVMPSSGHLDKARAFFGLSVVFLCLEAWSWWKRNNVSVHPAPQVPLS